MQGFPEGWVDGLARTDALRCLGNAVVPQVTERFGRMVLGEQGGGSVQPDGRLLPTPTRTQAGGTPDDFLRRKRRAQGSQTTAITDLAMLIEQVLPGG